MNRRTLSAIALTAVACLGLASAKGTPEAPMRFQINVSLRQGNPGGSREAGTLKVLAEPVLVARDGQEVTDFSGGEVDLDGQIVEIGHRLRATPEAVDNGIRLRLDLEHAELLESGDDTARLRTDRAFYTRTVTPGEVLTLGWGKPSERTWVELSVREFED